MIAEATTHPFSLKCWLVIPTDAYHYFTLTLLHRSSQCVTLHGTGADPEKTMETVCDWPRPQKLNRPISARLAPPHAAHRHGNADD